MNMQKSLVTFTLILAAFFAIAIFSSSFKDDTEKQPKHDDRTNRNLNSDGIQQVIKSVNLDKDFSFAGEQFPMENFDVKERLDRELSRNTYWHSNTLLNIKKANKYFPVMEKILAEKGIPDDFKFLAVAESDLRNAVSPAGAKGFWQFLKGTGKQYGLEINNEVDERYHLEKATVAFTKYIKSNFDLNLNQETSRYVFRLVAIKEIMNNPQDFGFYIEQKDMYQPIQDYYEVEVNKAVPSWGDFANKYGISYRMLKVYNPWLISTKLTNKYKKTYTIKIPKK